VRVIRFTNNQILYSLDSAIKKILGEITERTPL
jgi:very-short-patch-repair endonuclease